jgi:hypothetical protein
MNLNSIDSHKYNQEPVALQARKSTQFQMPKKLDVAIASQGLYNIYPFCSLGNNHIFNGYVSLAAWIIEQKTVVVDGYAGVFWDEIKTGLARELSANGLNG